MLESPHGRGAGKTVTAEIVGKLYGGSTSVSMDTRDGVERLRQRLLAPHNAVKRVVVLDNVKGTQSSGEIESMVTAPVIDGHRLHYGDASRPNYLTWIVTANGLSLSRDLADRSVVIRLGKPRRSDFQDWVTRFIERHRLELIADICDMLRGSPRGAVKAENHDRWTAWRDAVLRKCVDDPDRVAAEIVARRAGMDADADDWSEVRTCCETIAERFAHDATKPYFAIPSKVLSAQIEQSTGQKLTGRGLATMLSRFVGVADADRLTRNPSRHGGRTYLWLKHRDALSGEKGGWDGSVEYFHGWDRVNPHTLETF